MNKIKCYLAGACKALEDEGLEWREKATKMLEQAAEWRDVKLKVINPVTFFSYAEHKHKTHKQVKSFYMNKIAKCDFVLVSLDDSDKSVGTGQELQFASDHHIPIIGFGTNNVYPWLAEVDCEVVFDSLMEAIDYIRDYYLL